MTESLVPGGCFKALPTQPGPTMARGHTRVLVSSQLRGSFEYKFERDTVFTAQMAVIAYK